MRINLLIFLFLLTGYAFAANAVTDKFQETSIRLKHREANDIISYLLPHLVEHGRISGQGKSISILSSESNINEILVIIGDLDRIDHLQLIISITMNINAVHNVNTRSIQVGAETWTKIDYGVTYSNRTREKLDDGKLIEKINYVKVTESFQIHTKIINENKNLTIKLRPTQESSALINEQNLEINLLATEQHTDDLSHILIQGKINEWISLATAINSIYNNDQQDAKQIKERQQLTNNMAIKVQILQ